MALRLRIVSSMEKLLPGQDGSILPAFSGTGMFADESLSFQVLLKKEGGKAAKARMELKSSLTDCLRMREVCYVPVRTPSWPGADENYLDLRPGLFPDLLGEMPDGEVALPATGEWVSVLVTAEPMGRFDAGHYTLTVKAEAAGETATGKVELEILPRTLPAQTLLHTEWFHGDCLADHYGCPVFSRRWWDIAERYIAAAARMGINVLFTPIHTPPLDTAVGKERPTVQLVGVTRDRGVWEFDFSLLDRWLALARKYDFRGLEISHFFTQWGAEATPKILVRENGEEKRLFGWDVPAEDPLYWSYLEALLPKLVARCEEGGFPRSCQYYHLSDEPHASHLERYARLSRSLRPLLGGARHMDALSDIEFYRSGSVEIPVAALNHAGPFMEAGVKPLWVYYCCGQYVDVPNRFIAMPGARTRIQGFLFWKYRVEGLLQWGFNFYYSQDSLFPVDPFAVTDGLAFPAGDPFIVYPGPDGPLESLRYVHMREALQDMRAMQALEELAGRPAAESILGEMFPDMTMTCYPCRGEELLGLRDRIHQKMKAYFLETKKEATS
ncbi:MAG: DUF4091 domain-containing protein [Christensenellales bacterium]|jgi:hypothetical protein